jgi:hypothetical protein
MAVTASGMKEAKNFRSRSASARTGTVPRSQHGGRTGKKNLVTVMANVRPQPAGVAKRAQTMEITSFTF